MSEYPWFDFDRVDYVTADTHFSHARISELADRPFTTVNEMNTELIRRWNETVAPTDVVLHLGDVALGPIEESITLTAQLNGHRYLVPGNHDRVSPATQSRKAIERFAPLYEAAGWTILPEVIEGTRHGYRILASHYPYKGDSQESDRHTSHRPRWDDGIPLLHGHTHARDHGPNGHQFHVGVDAHAYAPIPFTVIDEWVRAYRMSSRGSMWRSVKPVNSSPTSTPPKPRTPTRCSTRWATTNCASRWRNSSARSTLPTPTPPGTPPRLRTASDALSARATV